MKKAFRSIVTLLLISGWGLAASALHVVWTGSSPVIIPKDRLGARDTYVNISNWTADDVSNHPAVAKRLIATGKTDVLANAFKASSSEDLEMQIDEAIKRGPTTAPSPTVVDKVVQNVNIAVKTAKTATGN